MGKDKNDEIEIDLKQIFMILKNRFIIILLIGIIAALAVFIGTKLLIKPKYQSTTSLFVLNRQNQATTTYSDLQTSTQLTQDYKILVTSRSVLEKVISELNLNMTYEQLSNRIEVSSATNTRVIEITVTDTDPYKAKEIVDKVADISGDYLSQVMKLEDITIVDRGKVPQNPSSPNAVKYAALAAIIAILGSSCIFIITYLLNDKINTSDDIEKYLGLSTLAFVPLTVSADDVKSSKKHKKQIVKKGA